MSDALDIRREAKISNCGKYRYSLDRVWYDDSLFNSPAKITFQPPMIFVMLNPSTADAFADDPTIRRCINFAKREGFQWLKVMNLFAGRATKPTDLFKMDDPSGPENEEHWEAARGMVQHYGSQIVCAWGSNPKAKRQAERFLKLMDGVEVHCLGTTKDGHPKHPLYLANDTQLEVFRGLATNPQQ